MNCVRHFRRLTIPPPVRLRSLHASSRLSSSRNDVAFAFDIDGVLLRSSKPVGGSTEAVRQLLTLGVPFIFLTNGGGKSELARITDLRDKLSIPDLREEAIVQSHTPFRDLHHLKDKNVLVVGGEGDKCRHVAESYGFRNVILPGDIYLTTPSTWPFSSPFSSYYTSFAQRLPSPNPTISAILVFNDPRDFGLDLQLVIDLLLSNKGKLGTLSPSNGTLDLPNRGYQHSTPELYFSNLDLWWASSHPLPRLGQGAFHSALSGVWRSITSVDGDAGVPLQATVIGKPHRETYAYAEDQLVRNNGGKDVKTVYMIGDNPASDIAGANGWQSPRGTEWVSVLVGTGVWQPGSTPAHTPKKVCKDVFDAVQWALQNSRTRF